MKDGKLKETVRRKALKVLSFAGLTSRVLGRLK